MDRLRFFVSLLLFAHVVVLIWVAATLPIGPHEAKLYFQPGNTVGALMRMGRELLPGMEFFNIRLPFLVLHLINLGLFYQIARHLLKKEAAVLTAFVTFLLLPGIVSSGVLASPTGLVLALYQAFLLAYIRRMEVAASMLLVVMLFVDKSSVILFFALLTYALWHRRVALMVLSGTLLFVALDLYGFDLHGKPVNYFVDTVALYAAIFSPLLFLYFFYAMYRILLKGERNIVWHVSFSVLIFSLLLSLRQKISVADFAPYVVVAVPLMVDLFWRSYRVRLPQFRKKYFVAASIVYGVLIANTLVLLIHRPLFGLLENPKHHFAYRFYHPYWCAAALKKAGIERVRTGRKYLGYQLRFYGIGPSDRYELFMGDGPGKVVTIRYAGRLIGRCRVSKINR